MLIIIKVYITQEPSMGKFLTSAIELLITSQMPSYERISQRCNMLFGTKRRYSGNINDPLQTYIHMTLRRASLRRLVVVYLVFVFNKPH